MELPPHHFLRPFKARFGLPPYQYLVQRRLQHARHLLATTDSGVTRKVTWGQTRKRVTPLADGVVALMNGAGRGGGVAAPGKPQDVSLTGCLPMGLPSVRHHGRESDLLSPRDGRLYTRRRKEAMNLEANRPAQLFDFPLVRR